jgi:hypothetical protein
MHTNHICSIPSFLYDDLIRLFSRWMTTGKVEGQALQDVLDAWTCTKSGKRLDGLLDAEAK